MEWYKEQLIEWSVIVFSNWKNCPLSNNNTDVGPGKSRQWLADARLAHHSSTYVWSSYMYILLAIYLW